MGRARFRAVLACWSLLCAGPILVAGCSEDQEDGGTDADAGRDGGPDRDADLSHDGDPDRSPDADHDTGSGFVDPACVPDHDPTAPALRIGAFVLSLPLALGVPEAQTMMHELMDTGQANIILAFLDLTPHGDPQLEFALGVTDGTTYTFDPEG